MKTASLKEIKIGLESLNQKDLMELCLRLAKFKKDNKDLLTYLLFEASDEAGYINAVKAMADELFLSLNTKNLYIAKKNIRKIIRLTNKYIKYSNENTTGVSLLIYLIGKINESDLDMDKSVALSNLYNGLIKKVNKEIGTLHEDLQYDFRKELEEALNPSAQD